MGLTHLRQLNLNALRVVESAARTGSFVRAAEEQLITPSAVSQRIKNLEAQLRFKIFNRRNNTVELTTEGDAFMANVRDALDTILAAGIEAAGREREDILKISALPTFIVRWLMHRLPAFQASYPDVRLNLTSSYSQVNFAREDVDVAIWYGNGRFPGLKSRFLFPEKLIPVCSPDLLKTVCKKHAISTLDVSDLRHFTLLHSDTCALNWQSWLIFAGDDGDDGVIQHAPSMYFDSCMMTIEAAHAGVGATIGSLNYIIRDLESGKLVAPFDTNFASGSGFYLVYPENHGNKKKIQIFENWLVAQAEPARALP